LLEFFLSTLEQFFSIITVFISFLGYWGIAIGMAIESANVPLPSEVILPFGGYLVSEGHLSFWGTVIAGTAGGTVGSVISYYIGLYGGRPFLVRYGKYLGISPKKLAVADRWFAQYGETTVFFTRLMPVARTFISLPAGIAGMDFKKFVVYTFFGSLPWSILLVYLGVKLGENWETLKTYFHFFDVVIVAGIILLVIYLWLRSRR